jgi:hypothetical protein
VVDQWTVVTEVSLIRQMEAEGRATRLELFAVQDLFREAGPEAFGLFAADFTGSQSWKTLAEPCSLAFFVQVRGRFLDIELEILPRRTIVFRKARRR